MGPPFVRSARALDCGTPDAGSSPKRTKFGWKKSRSDSTIEVARLAMTAGARRTLKKCPDALEDSETIERRNHHTRCSENAKNIYKHVT